MGHVSTPLANVTLDLKERTARCIFGAQRTAAPHKKILGVEQLVKHGDCVSLNCECYPGWAGEACDEVLVCPNDCSNHGRCDDGVCFCDDGYSANDCSEFLPPQRPPKPPSIIMGKATDGLQVEDNDGDTLPLQW